MTPKLAVLPLDVVPTSGATSWRTPSRSRRTEGGQLGRQSIFTAAGVRVGRELSAHASPSTPLYVDFRTPVQHDDVTEQVMVAALLDPERTAADGDAPVFVTATRSYLVGDRTVPRRPEQLVLEVAEPMEVDSAVLAGVRRLRELGFRIAVKNFVGLAGQRRLLPYADFVLVDARDLDVEGEPLLTLGRSHGARLLAQHIDSRRLQLECRLADFDLYQGDALEPADTLDRRGSSQRCG